MIREQHDRHGTHPLPARYVMQRRTALADLSREDLEARYRALPHRTASPVTRLSSAVLIDLIIWVESGVATDYTRGEL